MQQQPFASPGEALAHISETPWSNWTKADYTLEQWHAACLVHIHDGVPTSKSECKLPVKTPDGILNRNGVHAAAAALAGARGGLKGVSAEQKNKAAGALRRYYSQLDEDPPESLAVHTALSSQLFISSTEVLQYFIDGDKSRRVDDFIDDLLMHFGVKGMRWGYRNESRAATENFGKPYSHADGLGHGSKIMDLKKPDKLRVEVKNNVIDIRPKDGFRSKRAEQYHKELLDAVHEMSKEYPAVRDMKIEITPMSHQKGGNMMIWSGVPAAAAHLKQGEARLFYNDKMRGSADKISPEARRIQPGIQEPGFLGRHELGHVLSMAGNQMPSGWKVTHEGSWQDLEKLNNHINESHKALFAKHKINFDEVTKLSPYAATEPAEAFAEAAGYYHTPALRSQMSSDMQTKVKAMLDDVGGKKR